ncbi:MAG TPA: tetratricopeptide repeat-containing protein, partial [Allosphingosinicella sp.]
MSLAPSQLAEAALARGDLAAAYDITASAISESPSEELHHLQVLALARMGDTETAMRLFETYDLGRSRDPHKRAAGGRLLKDNALKLPSGPARQEALDAAYRHYLRTYRESEDPFPGINAATLALLAGHKQEARDLAQALLATPAISGGESYYMAVTKAEALLILGRADDAIAAIASDHVAAARDLGAKATSRRHLGLLATELGLSDALRSALVGPLSPPAVVNFAGHMFVADAAREAELATAIGAVMAEEKVGFGYGGLACGADILFAEALLARGAELHVVLPFAEESFIAQSVLPGGEAWLARFRECLARASSVTRLSTGPYLGDPNQFGYSSRIAMGLAHLRAEHLGTRPVQLVVWDESGPLTEAGTGADVRAWQPTGARTRIIPPGGIDRGLNRAAPAHQCREERALAAILFTDFAGFSALSEEALPGFWNGVMRSVADVLEQNASSVSSRNSWGDALYAVTDSAAGAAEIALDIQSALARFDYAAAGLPADGGMRVGVHYGP